MLQREEEGVQSSMGWLFSVLVLGACESLEPVWEDWKDEERERGFPLRGMG